jgi:hypothetical protein
MPDEHQADQNVFRAEGQFAPKTPVQASARRGEVTESALGKNLIFQARKVANCD